MSTSGLKSRYRLGIVSIALVSASTQLLAADITDGAASTAQDFAQEQRNAAVKRQRLGAAAVQDLLPAAITLKLGLAYATTDTDSRRINLPFTFSYQTARTTGSPDWW